MTNSMTKNEVLDKVLFGYDVKVPDVLSSLDFDKVEMEEAQPMSVKRKYVSAAVIYAAACLAVMLILPFIIGDGVGHPKPNPGNKVTGTETETEISPDNNFKVYPAPDVNIADEVPEEYHEILIRYRSAVEAIVTGNTIDVDGFIGSPYEPVHAFTSGMYEAGLAVDDPTAFKFGYSLKDMNGDGTPELLLITENHVLLELYSIVDGEAKLLDYFRPRYTGVVLATNRLYTYGSGGAGVYTYTISKYDGEGNLMPHLEFGSDISDNSQYYYKAKDGGEREIISEGNFIGLVEQYPEIPAFSGEDNIFDLQVKYYTIAPMIKDKFIAALKLAIAEGKIEDIDFEDEDIICATDPYARDSDISVFSLTKGYPTIVFIYSDGEISHFNVELPVYMLGDVQYCDVDRNGKEDLLIYGCWGSGVYGFSVIYFDTNTNTMTELFGGSFLRVRIEEEIGENGETRYSIYSGYYNESNSFYIGTLEYANGHIETDLIYEGSLSEVVVMLMRGKEEDTETTTTEPQEVVTTPKETEPPAPVTTPKVTETSEMTVSKEMEPPETVTTSAKTEPPEPVITDPVIVKRSATSVTKSFCGLEYTMTLDKESYNSSDTVTVTLTLENKGDYNVGLCSYDYRVEDNYLDDVFFYEGEVNKGHGDLHTVIFNTRQSGIIKPGEKKVFTDNFDLSEMDDYSEWYVKTSLNYVPFPSESFREEFLDGKLDDKIKNVSLELDIYHTLPEEFDESSPLVE